MTAPSYTTDLTTITDADGGAGDPGTWAELTGYTQGSGLTNPDTDYYIQGSACTSLSTANKTGLQVGINYTHTTTFSFAQNECIFIWHVLLAGVAMDTFANGGLRLGIGPSNGNAYLWKVGGSDFGRNPYGGWQNYAIDPTYPNDYSIGTPSSTYQAVCCLPNLVVGISKGNLLAIDAVRTGRGTLTVSGGDSTFGYGTFTDMASANDAQSKRWGLFQEQAGTYLWKGLMSLGVSGGGLVDFRDSNKNITVDITPRTFDEFNRIEIHDANSFIEWIGINISSLPPSGYFTPGDLVVVDNADVNFSGCTFTDLGYFIFQSNSTITDTTFRRCEQVYWGNGLFDGCLFETPRVSAAIYTEDLSDIDNCTFNRSEGPGTEYGIHMGASGTYQFDGNTFTGYGPSGSTSAAIYHNSGGHLTINVVGGGDSPTVHNIGTSTSTVVNARTLTLTGLVSASEVRIYSAGTTTELAGIENSSTTFQYDFDFDDAGNLVDIVVHHVDYVYYRIEDFPLPTTNTSLPIDQQIDRVYDNPPGGP